MVNRSINKVFRSIKFMVGFTLMFTHLFVFAQEQPPRPINVFVSPVQGLNFGSFARTSNGGTVTIFPNGSRTSSGSIVLVDYGFAYTPALFEIEGNEGTMISLSFDQCILTGNNGGTMTLDFYTSDPLSPFVLSVPYPARTLFRIGGTLTVGNAATSPEGSYSGTFMITINQE